MSVHAIFIAPMARKMSGLPLADTDDLQVIMEVISCRVISDFWKSGPLESELGRPSGKQTASRAVAIYHRPASHLEGEFGVELARESTIGCWSESGTAVDAENVAIELSWTSISHATSDRATVYRHGSDSFNRTN